MMDRVKPIDSWSPVAPVLSLWELNNSVVKRLTACPPGRAVLILMRLDRQP